VQVSGSVRKPKNSRIANANTWIPKTSRRTYLHSTIAVAVCAFSLTSLSLDILEAQGIIPSTGSVEDDYLSNSSGSDDDDDDDESTDDPTEKIRRLKVLRYDFLG
jgi:hypothetical protein